MKQFRLSMIVMTVFMSLFLLKCSSDQMTNPYGNPPPPPPAGNNNSATVVMSGMTFNPATITVAKGTTVKWQNSDGVAHTATSDSNTWDTGNIPGGASKSITFNTAGTFSYNCIYHSSMGMRGTVIVQ